MTSPHPRLTMRALRRIDKVVGSIRERVQRSLLTCEERWSAALTEMPVDIEWRMEQHIVFHGVVFLKGTIALPPEQIQFIHVVGPHGAIHATADHTITDDGQTAFEVRFDADNYSSDEAGLSVIRADGRRLTLTDLSLHGLYPDAYHDLTGRFFASLRARGATAGGTVVEIGSRARSGNMRRELIQPMNYCGVDIVDGENVDVVCDAHNLRDAFEPDVFDAAFSISTFEHLAMPWKAAVELNYVLKVGAQALIASHQTFPIHDGPWDLWRFSRDAWLALFNDQTGFKIIETAYGEPAEITARFPHPPTAGLEQQPSFIGSVVLVEKTAPTTLRWDVPTATISPGEYPQ